MLSSILPEESYKHVSMHLFPHIFFSNHSLFQTKYYIITMKPLLMSHIIKAATIIRDNNESSVCKFTNFFSNKCSLQMPPPLPITETKSISAASVEVHHSTTIRSTISAAPVALDHTTLTSSTISTTLAALDHSTLRS